MIKLKLTRDQLATLCGFTNPAVYEAKVMHFIQWHNYKELDTLFNLIQIGEMTAKKWLFTVKKKYVISLKYSEAASLLEHTETLENTLDRLSYEYNVLVIIRQELHAQLINFQTRFNGHQQQNHLAGGNPQAGGTPQIPA